MSEQGTVAIFDHEVSVARYDPSSTSALKLICWPYSAKPFSAMRGSHGAKMQHEFSSVQPRFKRVSKELCLVNVMGVYFASVSWWHLGM